jgi:hypothetical protein
VVLSRDGYQYIEAEDARYPLSLVPRGRKKKLPYTGRNGSTLIRRRTACNALNNVEPQPSFATIANDASNTTNFGILQVSKLVSGNKAA